jgi:hypothetical protein
MSTKVFSAISRRWTAPTIAEECKSYAGALASLPLPLSPHDPGTKNIVAMLFDGRLDALLDRVFGTILPNSYDNVATWLDRLDDTPNERDEAALLALLSPDGPLFRVLMDLSAPEPRFEERLRDNWKNEFNVKPTGDAGLAAASEDADPFGNVYCDVPFSCVHSHSFMALAEAMDADIAALPADRVPALLALPVWRPPISKRPVRLAQHTERLLSLAVNPAAYFILRMLFFMPFYSTGVPCTTELSPEEQPSWSKRADEVMTVAVQKAAAFATGGWLGSYNPTTATMRAGRPRYGLYRELVRRYVEFLAPRQPHFAVVAPTRYDAAPAPRMTSRSTHDVLGGFFVQAVATVWQRFGAPLCELQRTPLKDVGALSIVLHALPTFTALLETVPVAVPDKRQTVEIPLPGMQIVRVRDEIMYPATALYRHSLRLLRQTLLSLAYAQQVPAYHTYAVMRLFATLATHGIDKNERRADAIAMIRYEVFSVIFLDVLQCLLDCPPMLLEHIAEPTFNPKGSRSVSDMIRVNSTPFAISALDELAGYFEYISKPELREALIGLSRLVDAPQRQRSDAAFNTLRDCSVLAWTDDGVQAVTGSHLIPITTGAIPATVSRLYAHVARAREELRDGRMKIAADRLLAAMAAAYPQAARIDEPLRDNLDQRQRLVPTGRDSLNDTATPSRSSASAFGTPESHSVHRSGKRTLLRADLGPERENEIFHGRAIDTLNQFNANDLLCRDVVFERGYTRPLRNDEVPALVWLTSLIDQAVHWVRLQRCVRSGQVPLCPRRHVMVLEDRLRSTALWVCPQGCNYQARAPTPKTAMGYALQNEQEATSKYLDRSVVCANCCLLLPAPGAPKALRRYFEGLTETFLCPDCASVPFETWSLRWCASRTRLMAIALVLGVLALVLWLWRSPTAMQSGTDYGPTASVGRVPDDVDDMW